MKTVDFGAYIVLYNFVIGLLVMISSEKLGVYAGAISRTYQVRLQRLTQISSFTFGACVAVLSGSIYLIFHIFRFGL